MKPQGRARKAYFTEKIQSKQKGSYKWRNTMVVLVRGALGSTTGRRCFE